jgi:hypothetical protein
MTITGITGLTLISRPANDREDAVINATNDSLLSGAQYTEDFTPRLTYRPSVTVAKIGEMAPRTAITQPSPMQILRLGAQAVAAQRR